MKKIKSSTDPDKAALFMSCATTGVLQLVSRQKEYFQDLYGLTGDDFILYCMGMIGSSIINK